MSEMTPLHQFPMWYCVCDRLLRSAHCITYSDNCQQTEVSHTNFITIVHSVRFIIIILQATSLYNLIWPDKGFLEDCAKSCTGALKYIFHFLQTQYARNTIPSLPRINVAVLFLQQLPTYGSKSLETFGQRWRAAIQLAIQENHTLYKASLRSQQSSLLSTRR